MPIRDKKEPLRLTRLGKLKIGDKTKSKGGKEIPMGLDHFRATGDYAEEFHKIFGEEPKEVEVWFAFEDIEENMSEWYRAYKTGGLYRRCDGIQCSVYGDETFVTECLCKREGKQVCDPTMILQVIILGMPVTGIWQIDSGGFFSRANVRSALTIAHSLSWGITGIPFILSVKREKSNIAGKPHEYSVLHMVTNRTPEELIAMRHLRDKQVSMIGAKTTTESKQIAEDIESSEETTKSPENADAAQSDSKPPKEKKEQKKEPAKDDIPKLHIPSMDKKELIDYCFSLNSTAIPNDKWNNAFEKVLNGNPLPGRSIEELRTFAEELDGMREGEAPTVPETTQTPSSEDDDTDLPF